MVDSQTMTQGTPRIKDIISQQTKFTWISAGLLSMMPGRKKSLKLLRNARTHGLLKNQQKMKIMNQNGLKTVFEETSKAKSHARGADLQRGLSKMRDSGARHGGHTS